ncbi:cytochrome C oxidase subunit IV family protein [Halobacteriaceae archaeon GCM10025711]
MVTTKLYTAIYVVLFGMATAQVLVESAGYLESAYWPALGAILVLSAVKAVVVAGYYQHLRFEPRSVSVLMVGGLFAALALTLAAAYSVT